MMILIIGYPGSGKSELAESMVTEMSAPGERIYLATMIPCGADGRDRVARHRKMREGRGFITIEAPFDVSASLGAFFASDRTGRLTDKVSSSEPAEAGGSEKADPSELSAAENEKTPVSYTVLLECLSNLTANEMFERHTDEALLADRIEKDISRLSEKVRDLVIVSNHFEITDDFDEDTVRYAEIMDTVNDRISTIADRTIRL